MKRTQGVAALVAGVVLVLAVLTVFAIELSDNQSSSRKTLESQARQRAVLVSGLIDAVFSQVARVGPGVKAEYSARTVANSTLQRAKGTDPYLALLGPHGGVIAHSSGFTAQARAAVTKAPAVSAVTHGQSWALGNIHRYGRSSVVDVMVGIKTPSGTRVRVTGIPITALSSFIVSELTKVPGVTSQHQLLVDGNGVVVGATVADRPAGYRFQGATRRRILAGGSGIVRGDNGVRYFDSVPLANTDYKLVLTVPTGVFFASVSGFRHDVPWIIFAAFGLVAIVALLLVRRSIKAAQRIRGANIELSEANAELGSTQNSLEQVNNALAVSNSALERSNHELERQARELLRSNAELDQFASIASHDLQEPLRKVRTFTERISDTEAANLSERGADYLRRANASAERMQILIEDLLRYSRVSTQGRPFTQVGLSTVAADVLDDLSAAIERAGAQVHVSPLPTVNADPSQMRQLLQNLISNALKFQREGVPPEVWVDATAASGWMTMTVRDNGIGFEPQYSRRIFRVFERLHGRGTYPGTGIGLALCRKIAERHGGTVVATGVPDQGATFTVTIQTERTEAVSDARARMDGHGTGGDPTDREEPYVTA